MKKLNLEEKCAVFNIVPRILDTIEYNIDSCVTKEYGKFEDGSVDYTNVISTSIPKKDSYDYRDYVGYTIAKELITELFSNL